MEKRDEETRKKKMREVFDLFKEHGTDKVSGTALSNALQKVRNQYNSSQGVKDLEDVLHRHKELSFEEFAELMMDDFTKTLTDSGANKIFKLLSSDGRSITKRDLQTQAKECLGEEFHPELVKLMFKDGDIMNEEEFTYYLKNAPFV